MKIIIQDLKEIKQSTVILILKSNEMKADKFLLQDILLNKASLRNTKM